MEKILKFSSTSKISGVYSNPPPKLKPQHYYSEHEEESHHYYDYSNYGLYVKIYTKKATCHVEPLKPIYETDHEPIFSSPLSFLNLISKNSIYLSSLSFWTPPSPSFF